ncbi:aminotransferase class V-fold PLP-dependent enzyme [Streptomyces sp. NPDC001941]|uniref:aminotransferase class V-fold PLP-dependent enzyme n=1 Tax=Streptomyces sp. NPDC001941 TaxID=3154659 RepID=UPI00332AAF6B
MTPPAVAHAAPYSADINWASLRGEFRLSQDQIHLANFFLASPPAQVRAAADRWRARLDSDPHLLEPFLLGSLADMGSELAPDSPYLQAKQAMARYLGAADDDVALVPNTTTGLALLYNGLSLPPGSQIVITSDSHYSHHQAAHRAAEKNDATVREVALYREASRASVHEILERIQAAITPRTRCLGVTWVSSRTGVKLPIPAIADLVADINRTREKDDHCLLLVDGVHGFGVEDQDAARLGADYFVAGAHKWFLGPAGTGILHARPRAWHRLSPTVPSFEIDATLHRCWLQDQPLPTTRASYITPGGFTDYANIFALTDTAAFHQRLGRAAITSRIHELNGRLRHELAAMPGIRLITPTRQDLASGFVCFQVPGTSPESVVATLASHHIKAATSPYTLQTIRLAAAITNNHHEIDRTLDVLHTLTPTTTHRT